MDDAGEHQIVLEDASAGLQIVRVRTCVNLRADAATRTFDALWRELYEPVERCLVELGIPKALL